MVYFISAGKLEGGPIKIGTTKNLSVRIKQINRDDSFLDDIGCQGELFVLGIVDGSLIEEKALHRRFEDLRITGEWFRAGSDLVEYIRSHARDWCESEDIPGPDVRRVELYLPVPLIKRLKMTAAFRDMTVSELVNEILDDVLPEMVMKAMSELVS